MKRLLLFTLFLKLVLCQDYYPLSFKGIIDEDNAMYKRGSYLIIVPQDDLIDRLSNVPAGDFIYFKKTQGFDVEVISIEGMGLDAEGLKEIFLQYKIEHPLLEYVLLVGDTNWNYSIPTFTIPSIDEEDIDVTDYTYTYSNDSNQFDADFFIGRWSIQTNSDLNNLISRSIKYVTLEYIKNTPFIDYLDRALLVAGNYATPDGNPIPPNDWPTQPVNTSNYILDNYLSNYSQVNTAFYHAGNYENGESNPIVSSSWNNGVGLINYIGWGDANGWHKPYFHRENVNNLTNGWMLPVVMSFVSNSGDFGNDYNGAGLDKCYGEAMITYGSMNLPKGAVAMVGSSDLGFNHNMDSTLSINTFNNLFENNIHELAPLLYKSKLDMLNEDYSLDRINLYFHIYNILGDPSIPIWLGVPNEIQTNLVNGNEVNNSNLFLNITDLNGDPIEDVVGAIIYNDELIGKGLSDQDGNIMINYNQISIGEEIDLYLNKNQFYQEHFTLVTSDQVLSNCTNPSACNYNPNATIDDGSCMFYDCLGECGGDTIVDECGECGGDNSTCSGCIDSEACNYDSEAIYDDGSCVYGDNCYGCTNADAINYEEDAVFDDGSCTVPDIIVPDDYSTIENALNQASEGSIIFIRQGIYYEDDITWPNTANIKLIGENREETIIDWGSSQGFNIIGEDLNYQIDHHTMMEGLTLRNAYKSQWNGHGAAINAYNAQLTLRNLIIENTISASTADPEGAVFFQNNSDYDEFGLPDTIIIENVIFKNNHSSGNGEGGALAIRKRYDSNLSLNINNCMFKDNSASEKGGAIYIDMNNSEFETSMMLNNCKFINNQSVSGAAISTTSSNCLTYLYIGNSLFINNNIINSSNNTLISSSCAVLYNSILFNNNNAYSINHNSAYNSIIENSGMMTNLVCIDCFDMNPLLETIGTIYSLEHGSPCIDNGISYFEHNGEIIYELSPDEYEGFAPDIGPWETSQMFLPNPIITEINDIDGDQGGRVFLEFQRSFHDSEGLQNQSNNQPNNRIESYQIELMNEGGWVGVGTYNAYNDSTYRIIVETLSDSSTSSDGMTEFRVIANMEEGNFVSGSAFGYSVDNIHPEEPSGLIASFSDNTMLLDWHPNQDEDLSHYLVFKDEIQIGEATTSEFIDSDLGEPGEVNYTLKAVDIHGNESEFSTPLSTYIPYVLNSSLSFGNNLIGLPGKLENDSSQDLLEGLMDEGPNVVFLLGQGVGLFNTAGGWSGNLNNISPYSGYWLNTQGSHDWNLNFDLGDVEKCESYEIGFGNNLLSYKWGSANANTLEALGGEEFATENFNFILGQGVGLFNTNNGWSGNLNNLEEGKGYWVNVSNSSIDFRWGFDSCAEPTESTVLAKESTIPEEYQVNQSTEQAFYLIKELTIDGETPQAEDLILAYHNDVLIGSANYSELTVLLVMGRDLSEQTEGFIEAGEVPTLKLYRANGEMIELEAELEGFNNLLVSEIESVTASTAVIPTDYALHPAYPNPFNPVTTISYGLPSDTQVILNVYDVEGRKITTLTEGIRTAGTHSVEWNADGYPSGVYFVKLDAGEFTQSQKLMLIK